jgi:uncharacterized SAM-binding protein YcdF (DUF218 family)
MSDAVNWVLGGAHFELVSRALVLVLLVGAIVVLWEFIRYLRALRAERELSRRLTMQQVYGSANDPRYADQRAWTAPRSSAFARVMRRAVHAAGVVSILLVLAVLAAMPFLGSWLESQDHLEKADYIVPLPGGDERFVKAADLYKAGFAPRVLASQEPGSASDQALRALERAGVPRGSIDTLALASPSIADTAEALKRFADGRKFKAILVTSGIQTLRTKVMFEDVVPRARFLVVSASARDREQPWWHNQDSAIRTITEASELARYWVASSLRTLQTEPDIPAPPAQASAPNKPADNVGAGTVGQRP